MDIKQLESIVEAILFAAGDSVSLEKICKITNQDRKTTRLVVENLIYKYKNANRGIRIREIGKGYQMYTNPEMYEYISQLHISRKSNTLSQAAFETLSIIAYKQPITRAGIEKARGVNSDSSLAKLIEKNLVKESGRLDAPGKPRLYATTEEFLRVFGFKTLKELPKMEMNELEIATMQQTLD